MNIRDKTYIFLKTGLKFGQPDLTTRRCSADSKHFCSQSKNKIGPIPSRTPEVTMHVDH